MSSAHLYRPVYFAILAALVTLGMKVTAYLLTGSVGLFSDAAESVVNLLTSVAALTSLWYSAKPVDATHTYGHEKIEYFSSGLEGVLVTGAAVGIGGYAVRRLIFQERLENLAIGTLVALAASLVNLAVAQWLLRVGRRHQSIVLEADGQHLMTDVWTSVALVGGLGLVYLTDIQALDPILAIAMALNILRTGISLIVRSFNGLMDHSLPPDEQAVVRKAVEKCLSPHMAYHALRTRQAGARRFVDFHLLVPGPATVRAAHTEAHRIEQAIVAALPGVEVTIHIEPIEEKASYQDSPVIPIESASKRQQ